MTAAQVNSQETEPAYVAGYSAIPWPVQRGTIQFVDRNGKRRRLSKTEIAVGAALYSCVNAPMGDKKKRQSEVGSPLVKPKQEYVCQIADVSQPTLWRALDSLARAGLISHKLIRDSKGKVRGCIYDLTNWLLLLPEKTLVSLKLFWLKAKKMNSGGMQETPEQGTLDLGPEACPETALPSQTDAQTGPGATEESTGPHYSQSSGLIQIQALLGEQHEHADKPERDSLDRELSPEQDVVKRLTTVGMHRREAWKCVRRRGVEVCLQYLEDLRYQPKKANPGGYLRSAIMEKYKFSAGYLNAKSQAEGKDSRQPKPEKRDRPAMPVADPAAEQEAATREAALASLTTPQLTELLAQTKTRISVGPVAERLRALDVRGGILAALTGLPEASRAHVRTALYRTLQLREVAS